MSALTPAIPNRFDVDVENSFADHRREIFVQVDRMFAVLFVLQWLAGIAAALILSPRTWAGSSSQIHVHVYAAVFVGGLIAAFPIYLVLTRPGETVTRYVIAVAQMMHSALLIHLSGGRIETHFHVFGSLAFLSLYRDWKVLIPATLVVAVDHFVRGIYFPQSVYGVLTPAPWRWLEHAGWVIFEDVVLVMACMRSEREMRGIAERIQSSERQTRLILDTVLDGVVTADSRGLITSWNCNAETMFGWRADEAIGRPVSSLIIPEACRAQFDGITRSLATDSEAIVNSRAEMTAIRRDGSELPVELAIAAVRSTSRSGLSVFVRDISERKRNELEVQQAREDAEAANRAKSAFLANMSHEIRTPMSAILGYADLMLEPSRSLSDRQDSLQVIRRNARHLLQLINDILDISKIEAGKMSTERIASDLPSVAAEVLSMIRPRALDKKLDLRVQFDGPIPRVVRTDPLRLKQILTNLLGNAIKFTAAGTVTLRVALEKADRGNVMRFEVADTGTGISEDALSRLFQPFGQADVSTTRRFGGTGLGLVISKRLAMLLGGDITVESTAGAGSTFRLTIDAGPLEGVEMIHELHEGLLAVPPDTTVTGDPEIRLNGRILLAEDGPDNQALFCLHLRRAGAEVVVAENGRIAVNLVRKERFDVILMDMQMPELDGYGASSEIRRRGIQTPIIALTAHAMAGDREKCIKDGCTDYLAKPVERDDLLRMVQRYLPTENAPTPAAPVAEPVAKRQDDPMARLIAGFVDRLPTRVAAITDLLSRQDLEELRRAVHQLKGAGKGYGFPQITDLAAAAEQRLKNNDDLERVKASVDELVKFMRGVSGYQSDKEAAPASN